VYLLAHEAWRVSAEAAGRLAGEKEGRDAGRVAGEAAGTVARRVAGEAAGRAAGRAAGEAAGIDAGRVAGEAAGRAAAEAAGEAAMREEWAQVGRQAGEAAGRVAGRQAGEAAGRVAGEEEREVTAWSVASPKLQVNAAVIAGALILLSVSSVLPPFPTGLIKPEEQFPLDIVGKWPIFIAAAAIIVPFAGSSILILISYNSQKAGRWSMFFGFKAGRWSMVFSFLFLIAVLVILASVYTNVVIHLKSLIPPPTNVPGLNINLTDY
jgi:hypothetical protein